MKNLTSFLVPVFFAFIIVSMSACKDEEIAPSPEALLTAHPWKFTGTTLDVDDTLVQSGLKFHDQIMAGSKLTFKTNHMCIEALDPSFNFTWEMSADGKFLTTTQQGFVNKLNVLKLTETELVLGDPDMYWQKDRISSYVKE